MNESVGMFLRQPDVGSPAQTEHSSAAGRTLGHFTLSSGRASISTIETFPKPGGPKMNVLYERDGYFTHVDASSLEASRNPYLSDHPAIFLSKDALKVSSKESLQSVFLVQQDSTLKNVYIAWREGGLVNLLEEVVRASEKGAVPNSVFKLAWYTLAVVRWSKNIYQSLSPHKMLPTDVMISTFSTTRHWSTSSVRCLAWHPQCRKIAVGSSDDTVRIFGSLSSSVVPMLKNRRQKNVSAIAWRFNSSSDIAVGCQGCVLLWRLDPNSVAAKPSSNFLTVIEHPSSTGPIVSLSWNSKTDQLAFGTCTDSSLVVWDIHAENRSVLTDAANGGVTQVCWTRDGKQLFCASPLIPFRIFSFEPQFSCRKLGAESGRLQAAAWSPDGSHLIFADSESPRLFGMDLRGDVGGMRKLQSPQPLVIADLTEADLDCQSGEKVRVGGLIQSIAWSAKGDRLAVLFKDTHCVAVYQAKTKPSLQLEPLGLLVGDDDEHPVAMAFQPSFENGSLLSTAWSSGRVQHVPMFNSSAVPDTPVQSSSFSSSFKLFGDSLLSPKLYTMQG